MNLERKYLVILNRETILGEFKTKESADFYAYVNALHGDIKDIIEVYEGKGGYQVAEEV